MRRVDMERLIEMVAMLIGFLFFFALVMALGTIVGMMLTYRHKALAALRLEHVPAASIRQMAEPPYSPARRIRSTVTLSTGRNHIVRGRASAA